MANAPLTLPRNYWEEFEVTDEDLEFLYNYLLEVEKPQTTQEIVSALVGERIRIEKQTLDQKRESGGSIYFPKNRYTSGQAIQIPSLDWMGGKVVEVRVGRNPDLPPFEVITVDMENGDRRSFAAGVEDHQLNQVVTVSDDDSLLDPGYVIKQYGEEIASSLNAVFEDSPDLVRIAYRWFPRALLVDINIGHLNLAEAVLDMNGGGPLQTRDLMEQIDLPVDVEANLNEFSLNLALQEDKRFDEVGSSGEILWYLHRLEPEQVREVPVYLKYHADPEYKSEEFSDLFEQFGPQLIDEHEPALNPAPAGTVDEETIALIFPHWRAGTLPLSGSLKKLFPTAYESPRIQFSLVDGISGEKFSGWVVRPFRYIYGLRDWYLSQGLISGSLVQVQRSENPGEIIVKANKKRSSREWIRTAMIGSDGGVVFSMLKHNISSAIDERMGIVVSNLDTLDEVWEHSNKQRTPLAQTIKHIMRELAKLSPQSHVHALELYAGINVLRRCPPGPILATLMESPWAKHLGNFYFRLEENTGGDTT